MKKILSFFIILIFLTSIVVSAEEKIDVIYFKTEACLNCQKVRKYLDELESSDINIIEYEIMEGDQRNLLYNYSEKYGLKDEETGLVPIIFVGEKYLLGADTIINELEKEIEYSLNNNIKTKTIVDTREEVIEKQVSQFESFALLTVFVAGFLDGFNPCALAMLLFFISFVFASGKKDKQILIIGFSFVLGTFVAYFGIGFGLLKLTSLVINAKKIMLVIYSITILLSIILAVLNFYDYLIIKKGDVGKIKNQLPKKIKHMIHNKIRSLENSKLIVVGAFLSGFIISFLEFFCTGQIYLPTITLILSLNPSNILGIVFLFIYNLAFVSPLIIICFLIYKGRQVMDVSMFLSEKLHIIKLLGAIFFISIALIILRQVLIVL